MWEPSSLLNLPPHRILLQRWVGPRDRSARGGRGERDHLQGDERMGRRRQRFAGGRWWRPYLPLRMLRRALQRSDRIDLRRVRRRQIITRAVRDCGESREPRARFGSSRTSTIRGGGEDRLPRFGNRTGDRPSSLSSAPDGAERVPVAILSRRSAGQQDETGDDRVGHFHNLAIRAP
jgi:hypothetical protein